jgi:hypothetical protein
MTDEPETPGMIGPSPSERGLPAIPSDPAVHAGQSAREWKDVAETYVQRRMRELDLPEDRIGAVEHSQGGIRQAFDPSGQTGGTCDQFGRLYVDPGVLNPGLLKADYGEETATLFEKSRLRTRIDAIIAHEYEEHRNGLDHEAALKAAPTTELPISHEAREILRAMDAGWQRR